MKAAAEKPFSDEKLGGALLAAPGGVRDASGSRKRLPSTANPASPVFQRNQESSPPISTELRMNREPSIKENPAAKDGLVQKLQALQHMTVATERDLQTYTRSACRIAR